MKSPELIKAQNNIIDNVNEVNKGAKVHQGRLRGGDEVVDRRTVFS